MTHGDLSTQITASEVAAFREFAKSKLENGPVSSVVELAQEWEWQRREFNETVAELRECIADMEAGKGRLLEESIAEMRARYNIPEEQR